MGFALILAKFPTLVVARFIDACISSLKRHCALPCLIGESRPTPSLEHSGKTIGDGRTLGRTLGSTCRTMSNSKEKHDQVPYECWYSCWGEDAN